MLRVGLISDTHGLLRPEATAFLAGCHHIVHAGDVGDEAILDALAALAPVTAVRGNVDTAAWAKRLPETTRVTLGAITTYVLHDLKALDIDPRPAGIQVVSGHSQSRSSPSARACSTSTLAAPVLAASVCRSPPRRC
jgi:predicted phosphodiesterase